MHNYEECEKAVGVCRWCRTRAEAMVREHGIDIQELDSSLIFHEQPILAQIRESEDDGVHNPNVRALMGLDKPKRTNKRKPKVLDISNIVDALREMGALSRNEE